MLFDIKCSFKKELKYYEDVTENRRRVYSNCEGEQG